MKLADGSDIEAAGNTLYSLATKQLAEWKFYLKSLSSGTDMKESVDRILIKSITVSSNGGLGTASILYEIPDEIVEFAINNKNSEFGKAVLHGGIELEDIPAIEMKQGN